MAARPRRSSDPNASVMHLLHRAGQAANTLLTNELARHDTTPRQFVVLMAIAGNQGCRQTDLGARTGIDRTTVTGIVTRLVARELVERTVSEEDGRAKLVRLTPAGRLVLRRCRQGAAAAEEELLGDLPAADRRRLRSALETVSGLARSRHRRGAGAT